MTRIPVPTKEAVDEAYNKVITKNITKLDESTVKEYFEQFQHSFKERQPGLYKYVEKVCKGHDKLTNGSMLSPQFFLYMMIAIDSLYIQEEIDDVEKLFD